MFFVKEIAKRLKIDYRDLVYALPEELFKMKSKNDFVKMLEARRKRLLVYEDVDGTEEIFMGRDADRLIELVMPALPAGGLVEKIEEFKLEGIVASRGTEAVVRGKARIVLNPHKDPFEEGEILVASMTRPEFVTLMRKARGIVTNEGGVTSHAAIIAREFGIPCIVGTQEATHVFANGDLVEMRMNHGVVLKLE